MVDDVGAVLAHRRAFVVAAAGCGKTHLLGRIVADERSGRQLVLTHTHAGIAALRRRLDEMGVPPTKFHVDTIAGWCLRYGTAYPTISGLPPGSEANPDWQATYPGAERVLRTELGRTILAQSYDGALVDEYQDCSISQHRLIELIAHVLPCRAVGDPLQAIFGFRSDPCVPWELVREAYELLPPLRHPWRWERAGHSRHLGRWLVDARQELESSGCVAIERSAPVNWVPHDNSNMWLRACWHSARREGSTVLVVNRPEQCAHWAKRLGGHWSVVERFDNPELLRCAQELAAGDGRKALLALFWFLAVRMTRLVRDLRPAVEAIAGGRDLGRMKTDPELLHRIRRLAASPSPTTALDLLEGALAQSHWKLYRPECVYQLASALRECVGRSLADLPEAVAAARTRARHRGRRTHRLTIGTPLLVKGLEFDHAVVLSEPQFSVQGLYVALTRASKSLTVVGRDRTLRPSSVSRVRHHD